MLARHLNKQHLVDSRVPFLCEKK